MSDTSVNALVRGYLEGLAADSSPQSGIAGFLALAESIHAGSGPDGRSWTREELYELGGGTQSPTDEVGRLGDHQGGHDQAEIGSRKRRARGEMVLVVSVRRA